MFVEPFWLGSECFPCAFGGQNPVRLGPVRMPLVAGSVVVDFG